MKENGVFIALQARKPGPLNLPRTFCEPCAIKIAPKASLIGSGIQTGQVLISVRNITEDPFVARLLSDDILSYLHRNVARESPLHPLIIQMRSWHTPFV